jgi:Myb-like DNA-binding domain.
MKENPILPPPSPSPQQLPSFQKKNTTRPFQAAGRDPIPFQKQQLQRQQNQQQQQTIMEEKAKTSSPLLPLIRRNPHGLVAIPSKDQQGQQPIKSVAPAVLQQNKHTSSSSDGSIRANQSGNNVGIHNPCKQDTETTMSTATATTNTNTASSSSCCDIYDAMIGEINDLLQAAYQAQTLGRLKMASTYLLLAHARLVGLGKRFDSILMVQPPPPPPPPIIQSQPVSQSQIQSYPQPLQQQQQQQQLQQLQQSYTLGNGATSKAPRILNLTMDSPSMDLPYQHGNGNHEHRTNSDSNQELPSSQNIHTTPTTTTITSSSSGSNSKPMTNNNIMYRNVHSTEPPSRVIQEAQKTLAKILPTEVHLDTTMMEHLARAAMELHNKRTGRGMLQERSHKVSSSSSPPSFPSSSTTSSSVVKRPLPGGVAWTDEEKNKCLLAAQMYGSGNVDAIAAHVGSRTAGEVKAHLKNVNERGKIERQITGTDGAHGHGHGQDDGDDHDNEEGEDELEDRRHYHVDSEKDHGDVGSGKKRKMSHMIGSDGSRCKSGDGDDMSCSPANSSKRSRGTRNKAPSKAMLTLPHAVFDAKKMVSGNL